MLFFPANWQWTASTHLQSVSYQFKFMKKVQCVCVCVCVDVVCDLLVNVFPLCLILQGHSKGLNDGGASRHIIPIDCNVLIRIASGKGCQCGPTECLIQYLPHVTMCGWGSGVCVGKLQSDFQSPPSFLLLAVYDRDEIIFRKKKFFLPSIYITYEVIHRHWFDNSFFHHVPDHSAMATRGGSRSFLACWLHRAILPYSKHNKWGWRPCG